MTLPGIPRSCAQEAYVRRKVSHVVRASPSFSAAGNTADLSTLFGEMGLPDHVEKTRSSGPVRFERARHASTRSVDTLDTFASTGQADTMYTGSQSVATDASANLYLLRDLTRGGGNYTCDQKNKTAPSACTIISSSDNVFGNGIKDASDRTTAGADAHFGLQATWDYFASTFSRNGINGQGGTVYSRVHYGRNVANAFWNDSCACMTYGDGDAGVYPLVALDIVAHELAHSVMNSEAALTRAGESGALNESSSDIFGTLVEHSAASDVDVPDYWLGERDFRSNWTDGGTVYNQISAQRYMDDPGRDGVSPACWSGAIRTLADSHLGAGPNNHMFYLLAEGGISRCTGEILIGIGRDKAAKIWYKAAVDQFRSDERRDLLVERIKKSPVFDDVA